MYSEQPSEQPVVEKPPKPVETYSHQAAMAQAPVPFMLFGKFVYIKPLREIDAISLDQYIRFQYLQKALPDNKFVSPETALVFRNAAVEKSNELTYRYGDGLELFFSSQKHYAKLLSFYVTRATPELDEEALVKLCFEYPDDPVSPEHRKVFYDLSGAVFRAIPPPPKYIFDNRRKDEKPSFLPTLDEEYVVLLYRHLAKTYNLSMAEISELTHYQQYFLSFTTPAELQAQHALEQSLRSRSAGSHGGIPKHQSLPPMQAPQGTVSMSPAQYEEWLAGRENS